MRQYDLENSMLTWLDRYEEQEISEYRINREYFLFIDTQDTEEAEETAKKIMDGIRGVFNWIIDTQDTEDGLKMVMIGIEADEYGYDADEADEKVQQMIDEVLRHNEDIEDYDSDFIEAA